MTKGYQKVPIRKPLKGVYTRQRHFYLSERFPNIPKTQKMFNQPVFAGKWGDTPTGQDCNIAEVYVDFENELMATDGRNFDNSDYLMSNSVMIQNH